MTRILATHRTKYANCFPLAGRAGNQLVPRMSHLVPHLTFFFPECVARVPVSLGGLGVGLCSPSFAFAVATVRNRLRDRRKALHSGECFRSGPESVSS